MNTNSIMILSVVLILVSFAGTLATETFALVLTPFGRNEVPVPWHLPLIVSWWCAAGIGFIAAIASCKATAMARKWLVAISAMWCCYFLFHGTMFFLNGTFGFLE